MCGYVLSEGSTALEENQIVDLHQHLEVHAGMNGLGNPLDL
jgi:hypothetical protein